MHYWVESGMYDAKLRTLIILSVVPIFNIIIMLHCLIFIIKKKN